MGQCYGVYTGSMKPQKYSAKDITRVDLGSKVIHKYPTPTKRYDIARMVVKGRFPKDNQYTYNSVCDFFIFVLEGTGKVYAGDEIFEVKPQDIVFVPKKNKYAVDGYFSYVTIDVPAFYDDQAQIVSE